MEDDAVEKAAGQERADRISSRLLRLEKESEDRQAPVVLNLTGDGRKNEGSPESEEDCRYFFDPS